MINFLEQKRDSEEVYHSKMNVFGLCYADIDNLIELAKQTDRLRVRFCTHKSAKELLHQMFIVHSSDVYVRPHKHIGKTESMLVIEGDVDYITFDELGNVEDSIPMGNPGSGKVFYHTIGPGTYHALRIQSDWVVFVEITNGPFYEKDTKFGAWSPDGNDLSTAHSYIKSL